MKRLLFALLALAGTSVGARALVPDIAINDTATLQYQCGGGKTLKIRYLTGHNGQHFALLAPTGGKPLLFVQTIAASGMKYQADRYSWWTKGSHGDLYDATLGTSDQPILSCHSN